MLGIENLKLVAKFGITLGQDAARILADGKVTAIEGLSLLPDLMGISGILSAKDDIAAEFKDLDTAERAELNAYIASEFDLANDVLEAKIEKSIAAAISILDLVSVFKAPPTVAP